jgi:hypothetical protein
LDFRLLAAALASRKRELAGKTAAFMQMFFLSILSAILLKWRTRSAYAEGSPIEFERYA